MGSLLAEVGQLSTLMTLSLCDCKKLKPLPAEVGQLTDLKCPELSGCDWLGSLPAELATAPNGLQTTLRNSTAKGISALCGPFHERQSAGDQTCNDEWPGSPPLLLCVVSTAPWSGASWQAVVQPSWQLAGKSEKVKTLTLRKEGQRGNALLSPLSASNPTPSKPKASLPSATSSPPRRRCCCCPPHGSRGEACSSSQQQRLLSKFCVSDD